MKKYIALLVLCAILLAGCEAIWPDRDYVSVTPHEGQDNYSTQEVISVINESQIRMALLEVVENGVEHITLSAADFRGGNLTASVEAAIRFVTVDNAIGAYAVEQITYDTGTHAGVDAVAVNVDYRHDRTEIQRIKQAKNMDEARIIIESAIDQFESGVVLRIEGYEETDFVQYVADYADSYPELVMELPEVTFAVYPESGSTRVLEIAFTYQTGRETMRNMRTFVQPIFVGAGNHVSSETKDSPKFSKLYSYLMDRAEYTLGSSVTPSYTLLQHGMGDSKTFAIVFASMCRWAGLECQVVEGTRDGEVWYWNIIGQNGVYYHVDLMRCEEAGKLQRKSDVDMDGYEWDREAFPVCGIY